MEFLTELNLKTKMTDYVLLFIQKVLNNFWSSWNEGLSFTQKTLDFASYSVFLDQMNADVTNFSHNLRLCHIHRISRNLIWYRIFERMLEVLGHAGHRYLNSGYI